MPLAGLQGRSLWRHAGVEEVVIVCRVGELVLVRRLEVRRSLLRALVQPKCICGRQCVLSVHIVDASTL